MSATEIIEFNDVTEHTFDNTKLTLLNDKGQLLSQVSPDEIFFANYDGLGDGSGGAPVALSRRGGKTAIFSGVNNTASVTGGLLTFQEDRSVATYQNITDIVDDFAFRCRIQAIITSTVVDRDLFSLKSNVDSSEIRFFFSNNESGITRMNAQMIDSVGGITNSTAIVIKDLSVDPNWNIAISNDDNGNILFYVDGVLKKTLVSPAFDFTDMNIIFGDNSVNFSAANFDNVQLFKSDAILADFAFPFPELTTFVLSEQAMITDIPAIVDEVLDVTIVHTIPLLTQLKFFTLIDGVSLWFDATNWVTSARTLAQTNTEAEIKANLSALPLTKGIGSILQFGHVFKSDSGYATPLLERLTIEYKLSFKSGDVTTCTVFGTVRDNSNKAVAGATIRVQSSDKFFNNVFIGPSAKVVTTAEGKFSISVPETVTAGLTVDFTIDYIEKQLISGIEADVPIIFEFKNRIIPILPTREISLLVTP